MRAVRKILLAWAGFAIAASADVIPVGWSTTGAFSADHTGLNFAAVSNQVRSTSPAGSLDIVLGTFTLDSLDTDLSGNFILTVLFSRPDINVGGNSQQLTVTYSGVDRVNNDTASMTFDPFQETFDFTGADGVGSFVFSVYGDVDLSHKLHGSDVRSGTVYGHITNATAETGDTAAVTAVPEPSSLALFLTPAAAAVGFFTTRRKLGTESGK